MFELPDAKRVRREELFDADSTRHSSPEEEEQAEIQAKLRAQLSNILSVDFGNQEDGDVVPADQEQEDQDQDQNQEPEFEFRLFSKAAPQKVVLAPAENEKLGGGSYDENSGGIVEPRPLSYYIRGELSNEQKEQFAAAAITAADILRGAQQRAWGLELPWRVTKITVSASSPSADQTGGKRNGESGQGVAGKKKKGKLGKKGRIVARTKQKAALELEKQKMTKEEHLKEKKKRLNREKKLKRRQKEKEKKLAAAGGAGGPEAEDSKAGQGGGDGDGDGDDSMSEGEN